MTPHGAPGTPVVQRFESRVRLAPDATAVVDGETVLSYGELNSRANRLAALLAEHGAGPERIVALALPRSWTMLVAVLAVLKSGAAYLPLDPDHPGPRLARLLRDARADLLVGLAHVPLPAEGPSPPRVLLDDPEVARRLRALPDTGPGARPDPRHLAYVVHTSGSTGEPKGVMVEHAALAAYVDRAAQTYRGAAEVAVWHTSSAFDGTVTTFFTPLVLGGRIHVASLSARERTPSPQLRRAPCAFLKGTPSHLPLLNAAAPEYSPSKELVLGGEVLTGAALARWRERHPDVAVHNVYGPTEATVNCAEYRIAPAEPLGPGPVPLGTPHPGMRIHLLDERLRPVPVGGEGELHIAGPQLARGYLGRAALTAARFVPDPWGPPGSRMYRTGDIGRQRPDGLLEFVGRADHQVKLWGYRVELGEIEAVLAARPEVHRAVVLLRDEIPGDRYLAAYVVPEPGSRVSSRELRGYLAGALPDYMVPAEYVVRDELPLTPNGKVDRKALLGQ
ncbi:amino acid adenylation domain-containing protein [Streptomyces naphthomycinicus]|uniref:amino acid adenylation domain-containing protein n=1 Tax=Streptomyces naphthomycinicus TaxID=2872625 RepID=UPI001CECDE0D|nr:amino acid adenylation domain-containing protein [Streptomyces sp. TML10]